MREYKELDKGKGLKMLEKLVSNKCPLRVKDRLASKLFHP